MGQANCPKHRQMRRPAKAPKFCHGFQDRHGRARWYFRRHGRRVALPGLPWSPEFMAAYQAAENGETPTIGENRTVAGTVGELVARYLASNAYTSLAPTTRQSYKCHIERFREQYGAAPLSGLEAEHIRALVAAQAISSSHSANTLRTVLRTLLAYGVDEEMLKVNPATDVKKMRVKIVGHRTWEEEDIAAYEAKHPIGTREQLAFTLMLYTGQRRTDIARLGPKHISNGILTIRQSKTGNVVSFPVHSVLRDVIDRTPSVGAVCFLPRPDGQPMSPGTLSNMFSEWAAAAGVPAGSTCHGLRKAACRRLAEAGCSTHEIMAISGHKSLAEVEKYTLAANMAKLGKSAMNAISEGH